MKSMKQVVSVVLVVALVLLLAGCAQQTLKDQGKDYIRLASLSSTGESLLEMENGVRTADLFEFRAKNMKGLSVSTATYQNGALVSEEEFEERAMLEPETGAPLSEGLLLVEFDEKELMVSSKMEDAVMWTYHDFSPFVKTKNGDERLGTCIPLQEELELTLDTPIPVFVLLGGAEVSGVGPCEELLKDPAAYLSDTQYAMVLYVTFLSEAPEEA